VPHLQLPVPQIAQITHACMINACACTQVAEEAEAANNTLGVRIDEVQAMMEDEVHQMDEFVEAKLQQVRVRVGGGAHWVHECVGAWLEGVHAPFACAHPGLLLLPRRSTNAPAMSAPTECSTLNEVARERHLLAATVGTPVNSQC